MWKNMSHAYRQEYAEIAELAKKPNVEVSENEDNEATVPAVASVLSQSANQIKSGAKGPIYFCLMDPALPGEVEIDIGCEFPVTPQVKGAIKSLGGVLEVEDV